MSVVDDCTEFQLVKHDGTEYVAVDLTYYSDDPFAVHLTFYGSNISHWVIARDLLADGMVTATGHGDVLVRPAGGGWDVEIELRPGNDDAVFLVAADQLSEFLDRTFDVCPAGAEPSFYDVDARLTELLNIEES